MTEGSGLPVSPRILVIEDDISFQKLIRARLKKRWPKTDIVVLDPTRGGQVDADFKALNFDVVLLDYEIGPLNGLDLLVQFRKHKAFPPVIMITGTGGERLAVSAMRAGAVDYLPKQELKQETLIGVIEQALANRPLEQKPAAPAPDDEPLPVIEGYKIIEKMGRGKAGHVYRATQKATGNDVALKVILADLTHSRNEELIDRAVRECTLMQELKSPRVAQIVEQRFTDDGVIIAMELLPRGSVRDLTAKGPLDRNLALKIIRGTAEALAEIHDAGVIHRDLKPANVMLREDDSVALVDFGIAREIEAASDLTRAGEMLGTASYVSPEQARGEPVDRRTDLYSLGVMLFELLSDKVPYKALTQYAVVQKHLHAPLPDMPPDLWIYQGLVHRLMAKSAKDRYPDARAFINDLDGLAPASA